MKARACVLPVRLRRRIVEIVENKLGSVARIVCGGAGPVVLAPESVPPGKFKPRPVDPIALQVFANRESR